MLRSDGAVHFVVATWPSPVESSLLRRIVVLLLILALGCSDAPSAAQASSPPLAGHECADFDSQIWAQAVYDADRAGNPALAPGADGRVCPDLPSGFAPAL